MREPYTDADDCGSTRGYYRHRAEGTETCQDCRDAWTAYNRGRARSPDSVEREKKAHAARERARVRLAREYPERYRELVNEELERGGVYRKVEG